MTGRILLIALLLTPAVAVGRQGSATGQAETSESTEVTESDALTSVLESADAEAGPVRWAVLVTVVGVMLSVVLLATGFTRIVVVLGLVRQALATPQLPPNQVLFAIALLLTVVVMSPVISEVHTQAVGPYLAGEIDRDEMVSSASASVRDFMIRQLEAAGNVEDVYLFLDDELAGRDDLTWRDVPTTSLISAFVVSELKVAFNIGFRIFLPFVVIDLLVASVLVSMGMLMLPPVLVSLPLKLLLFVLADGWGLVVGGLVGSFG
ncbi:MAG: flagellar type III secretion system pore protein FliP [Phycisphaerae bacterium]